MNESVPASYLETFVVLIIYGMNSEEFDKDTKKLLCLYYYQICFSEI